MKFQTEKSEQSYAVLYYTSCDDGNTSANRPPIDASITLSAFSKTMITQPFQKLLKQTDGLVCFSDRRPNDLHPDKDIQEQGRDGKWPLICQALLPSQKVMFDGPKPEQNAVKVGRVELDLYREENSTDIQVNWAMVTINSGASGVESQILHQIKTGLLDTDQKSATATDLDDQNCKPLSISAPECRCRITNPSNEMPCATARTKRKRSWCPKSSVANTNIETTPASERDHVDNFSADGSDLDNDSDCDEGELPQEDLDTSAIGRETKFQSAQPGLVSWAYDKIKKWMRSVRYIERPEHRKPLRKLARTGESKPQSISPQTQDTDNPERPVLKPIAGYFHLSCPFYVYNPVRHQSCVLKHELKSIEDVIDHLIKHHREPAYCPRCGRTFCKFLERDNHIRERSCGYQPPVSIEGVNDRLEAKLVRRHNQRWRVKERWLQVYATLFPMDARPHGSAAYLKDGVGLAVSLLRDYWAKRGRECVEEYLSSHGLVHRHRRLDKEEKVPGARLQLVLGDLLQRVVRDHVALSGNGQ